jgi:hypothetical protein
MNRGVDPMRILLALSLLAVPTIARADWMEASSPHFVVYADESEKDIRQFAEQLERYHSAMTIITAVPEETPSPSNRITVYVVSSPREVQRLLGGGAGARNVDGFYLPRAGGPLAFVPRVRSGGKEIDQSMIVLLHEYAHHFTISNSTFPSPRWLDEGAAEFFSSARFGADGGVTIGLPNAMRYVELAYAKDVTVEELLDPDLYEKRHGQAFDSFYGKSWALYHYLVFEPSRRGQMHNYLLGMAAGKTSRTAAEAAFGDLKQLDHELDSYLKRSKILSMVLAPVAVTTGKIDVRPLRPGEAAMMPVRMRSRRGSPPSRQRKWSPTRARSPQSSRTIPPCSPPCRRRSTTRATTRRRLPPPMQRSRSIPGRSAPTSRRATRCSARRGTRPTRKPPTSRRSRRSSPSTSSRTTTRCR